MIEPLSPLRYPGSKANLANYFEGFLQRNLLVGCTLYEPYAGSAALSLAMLAKGLVENVVLVERDALLFSFWKAVTSQADALCDKIDGVKVNVETWLHLQACLDEAATQKFPTLDLGFAALFLNRTNFSGVLGAKPIGGVKQASKYTIDCRFNKTRLIRQIQLIAKYKRRIRVHHDDALKFLTRNRQKIESQLSFVYFDPPYWGQGKKLYRYYYTTSQHSDLARFVDRQRFPWMVSIDNHPEIRKLYKNQKIVPIFLNYVVKQSRKVQELLISNIALPEPQYRDTHGKELMLHAPKRVLFGNR